MILYIVATPIGTLGDFSPRAQEILKEVDIIFCEDTRRTGQLLSLFGIKNKLVSLHLHNERDQVDHFISLIRDSPHQTAALVSDAGTPCIRDPGAYLVKEAHAQGVKIWSVPGPSSLPAALAASGMIAPRTIFSGFLEKGAYEAEFALWQNAAPCVAVFFESPKRIQSTLLQLQSYFGGALEVCVSKEISKKFETHLKGAVQEVHAQLTPEGSPSPQGEFVICVNVSKAPAPVLSLDDLVERAHMLMSQQDISPKEACKTVAKGSEFSAKEIYSLLSRRESP